MLQRPLKKGKGMFNNQDDEEELPQPKVQAESETPIKQEEAETDKNEYDAMRQVATSSLEPNIEAD